MVEGEGVVLGMTMGLPIVTDGDFPNDFEEDLLFSLSYA